MGGVFVFLWVGVDGFGKGREGKGRGILATVERELSQGKCVCVSRMNDMVMPTYACMLPNGKNGQLLCGFCVADLRLSFLSIPTYAFIVLYCSIVL